MKNLEKLTNIIESILFVSGTQVAIEDITEKLNISDKDLSECVKILKEKYSGDSGIQLLTFNKKLQFSSNPQYSEEVSSVLNPIKERELSKSMLETANSYLNAHIENTKDYTEKYNEYLIKEKIEQPVQNNEEKMAFELVLEKL